MTRQDKYLPLWRRLSAEVRSPYVVLRIGDEISKTLTDLEKRKVVGHDAAARLWWLTSRPPPERPVTSLRRCSRSDTAGEMAAVWLAVETSALCPHPQLWR